MSIQLAEDAVTGNHHDADYDGFLARVQARFEANVSGGAPVFQTDATNLWELYLGSFLGPVDRQYHNCHACRHFIERFGGLVTIGNRVQQDGSTTPAIWDELDAPEAYKPAVAAMARAVKRAKVTGVFLSSDAVWGTPETGVWHHLAVKPPASMVHKSRTVTAFQAAAAKAEDFKTVMHALNEFTQPHLEQALVLLRTESLYRSEKVLGQAEWLHGLHVARAAVHGPRKANVVWRAIATAPAGFCHPRSSMIGTLLEDIAAGKDFSEVSRAFAAKMNPLQYQRPQAAPTAGALATAEKLVAQLGAAGSLARRFARLDEVKALWRPAPAKTDAQGEGVFGHLKPKTTSPAQSMAVPAQTMTWDKFQRAVLPTAERIEVRVPSIGPYGALVTAVNPDAPPILQWDTDSARNPVSWYVWNGVPQASQFGLRAGEFVDAEAIALKPSMWNGGGEHHGFGVFLALAGARETRSAGAALFPEILKAEFHGIRSVIETYSRHAVLEGMDAPHVAGLVLTKGHSWNIQFRVTSGGQRLLYTLDRWD